MRFIFIFLIGPLVWTGCYKAGPAQTDDDSDARRSTGEDADSTSETEFMPDTGLLSDTAAWDLDSDGCFDSIAGNWLIRETVILDSDTSFWARDTDTNTPDTDTDQDAMKRYNFSDAMAVGRPLEGEYVRFFNITPVENGLYYFVNMADVVSPIETEATRAVVLMGQNLLEGGVTGYTVRTVPFHRTSCTTLTLEFHDPARYDRLLEKY